MAYLFFVAPLVFPVATVRGAAIGFGLGVGIGLLFLVVGLFLRRVRS